MVRSKAQSWLTKSYDAETRAQVQALLDNEDPTELIESFYKDLEFGTGGLRGIMGVGSNRMNIYTVGAATQGLSNYLKKEFADLDQIKVVIGHDCRNNSRKFAEISADIFSANGIKVYLFEDLRPTPEMSYTIRKLGCQSGIILTASHNPKEYNGYKAYWVAEGRKLCPELARGAQLETLFYTESAMAKCPELAGLPGEHYLVEDHVADKLADVGTHQGVFGVFRTPVHTLDEVKAGGRYLALERVQDPGNVGTLLRSAAAFGFDGVILSDGCASVYAPKTLRASMGAAVRIPVIEAGAMPDAITRLREKGITCLAAALYKSQPLSAAQASCPGGVCVVIGSEGQGLTDETIAACSSTVRIPMTDRVESLNAGIAGSILLWHFREESL